MQRALPIVVALSVLAPSAPCFAAENWLGTWTLNVAKKGGKLQHTVRVEVSSDGKTLTVTQTGNVNNYAVYERKP